MSSEIVNLRNRTVIHTTNTNVSQEYICDWKIQNFSYANHKSSECITSPFIVVESHKNIKFCLCIIPRPKQDQKYIGCTLMPKLNFSDAQICNGSTYKFEASFEVSILDVNNVVNKTFKFNKGVFEVGKHYGKMDFIKRQELIDRKYTLLPMDTLSIRCKMNTPSASRCDAKNYLMQTHISVNRHLCVWKIKDILSIKSSERKVMDMDLEHFKQTFLSITLTDDNEYKIEIHAVGVIRRCLMRCTISVMDTNGTVQLFVTDGFLFENSTGSTEIKQIPHLITRKTIIEKKSTYLKNDVLTLSCEFVTSFGDKTSVKVTDIAIPDTEIPEFDILNERVKILDYTPKVHPSLINSLWNFFNEGKYCDVTLQTQDREFPMHKVVLCAMSPVFRAMFERDMKEKENDKVSLPELDTDTVERMVIFMYKNEVKDLEWTSAINLYYASDLYEILPLKQRCSSFLSSNLSNSNVCEVVVLADMLHDEGLKISAREYIFCNGGEILISETWQSLEKSNPHVTTDILRWMYLKRLEPMSTAF